jgi:hypothetical protein
MISLAALVPLKIKIKPYASTNPADLFEQYAKNLGEWLLNGLLCYQSNDLRHEGFEPVNYLIGTSATEYSYIESLCTISRKLADLKIGDKASSLTDDNIDISDTAEDALMHGSIHAFNKLIEKLNTELDSDHQVTRALIDFLIFSGMTGSTALPKILPTLQDKLRELLESGNEQYVTSTIEILDVAVRACDGICHAGTETTTTDFLKFVSSNDTLPDPLRIDAALMFSLCKPDAVTNGDDFFAQPWTTPLKSIDGWQDWLRGTLGLNTGSEKPSCREPVDHQIAATFFSLSPRSQYPEESNDDGFAKEA